jgi:hypothetical protein
MSNIGNIKSNAKGFIAGVVVTLLLASGAVALAAGTTQITATQDQDVKIIFHGEEQTLKDANGKTVYPLTYEGTIYVPIRGISQLFDEPVSWDGATRSATIGTAESAPTSGDTYTVGNPTPFTFPAYSYDYIGYVSKEKRYTTNVDSVVIDSAVQNDKGETVLSLTVTGHLSDVVDGASKVRVRVIGYDAYGTAVNFGTEETSIDALKDGSTASGKVSVTMTRGVIKIGLDTNSAQTFLF